MQIEEMRKIAAARRLALGTFNWNLAEDWQDFTAMADSNFDKLLAVAEAAKAMIDRLDSYGDEYTADELRTTLEELERDQ